MSRITNKPTAAEIQDQLRQILASETFATSTRLQEFLKYLVDEALRDGRPRIKEFSVGVAVFGRDENFDPRIDSVVRVQAGRLRTKLHEYYANKTDADRIHIDIPKGAYLPVFEFIADSKPPVRAGAQWRTPIALVLVLLVAGAAAISLTMRDPDTPVEKLSFPTQSVAVLPLSDWTGNTEDYFSEAMTDVLIAELSERPQLRVTSLTSVMSYRDSALLPSQIAEQLGVGSIVEGTVFRDAGRVRITANLIDANTNRNLWSKTFNRSMSNALTLQEEVASEIATQLVGELVPPAALSDREINPLAYEAFLKGAYWRNRLTPEGFNRGLLFFHQAVELQPDYAEAYAAMASCHCRLAGHGIEVVRPDLSLPEASQLAKRAMELDDALADPHAVIGIIKFKYEWDADAARAELENALQRNPSLFEAHLWLSQVAEGMERHELAVEHARHAYQVNPLSVAAHLNLGWQLYQSDELQDAVTEFDELIEFDPQFWGGYWGKGHVYRARGQFTEAIDLFHRAVELDGGHTLPIASLGYTYAVAGEREKALALIEQLQVMSRTSYVSPVHFAMIYAGLGESELALEWLNEAFDVRARAMAWLTVRHEFDSLHSDSRFIALVSAVGIVRMPGS